MVKRTGLILRIGTIIALLLLPLEAAAADHAVILMYHHVAADTPPSTSVTPEQFEDHVSYLDDEGYSVWPVSRIVSFLREGRDLPDRCVGITFDDAYVSVYTTAFPLLQRRKMPFTVFVSSGGVDAGYKSHMTWEQMREMTAAGASIAGHSRSHGYLVRRGESESEADWLARVTEEIEADRRRIREETGADEALFAWPYGEYTGELKELLAGLGLTGFGQHSGPAWKGSDFEALPRFPMAGSYAEPAEFRIKVQSLPLPVLAAEPADPLLHPGAERPFLKLVLGEAPFGKEALACYAGGERAELSWGEGDREVTIRTPSPVPRGRSRYNCTALHEDGKRYFWYSHLWIKP
jgi:peptidoglycan/xylan/chitin deacetylase (PgdA/CDA1 family)